MATYSVNNIKIDNGLYFTPGPTAGNVLSINSDGSTTWISPQSGSSGASGTSGSSGSSGTSGSSGSSGTSGVNGGTGSSGSSGVNGSSGTSGSAGTSGTSPAGGGTKAYKTGETNSASGTASSAVDLLSSTSTSSLNVGTTGTKTLTMGTNLAYIVADDIYIKRTSAPTTQYMQATITAYNPTTGATTISVYNRLGTGTYTDWTILGGNADDANGWRAIQTNRYTNISGTQIQIPKLAGLGLTFSASSLGQTNIILYSTPTFLPKPPNEAYHNPTGAGGRIRLIIGTGSAPAAGTAASSTNGISYGLTYSLSQESYFVKNSTFNGADISYRYNFGPNIVNSIVNLTPNTTYWIDLQLTSNGYSAQSSNLVYATGYIYIESSNIKYSIVEIN